MRRAWVEPAVLLAGGLLGWLLHGGSMAPETGSASPVRTPAEPSPEDDGDLDGLREENARLREQVDALEKARGPEPGARPPRIPREGVEAAAVPEDGAEGTLRIRVVDADGRPVPGTTVRTSVVRGERITDERTASTDAGGSAEFTGLAAGERHVEVEVPQGWRFFPARVRPADVTEVIVPMGRGAVMEGEVRHAEEGPLAEVDVILSSDSTGTHLRARSGRDGRYRFDFVAPGSWKARLEGGAIAYSSRVETEVEMPEDGPLARDFLVGVPTVSGTVLDRTTRRPLPAATVSISGRLYRSATTDAAGAYRFLDLPAGRYRVAVSRNGYATEHLQELTVPPGGQRFDAELSPASALSIAVTDPTGQPYIGDLDLMITAVGGKGSSGADLRTDAEGRVSYDRILPGRYELRFEAGGIGEASLEVVLVPGDNSLDVRLQRK